MDIVIGSTGFIGRHIVKQLAERQPGQVRALVRKSSDRAFLDGLKGVEILEGDVLDPASLDRALQGVDTVYHAAAITGASSTARHHSSSNISDHSRG